MKIVKAELYGITIPLKKPFAVSKYTFTNYFGYILRLTDEDGVTGVGESLQLETPWYSAESFEPAGIVLAKYLLPLRHASAVPKRGGVACPHGLGRRATIRRKRRLKTARLRHDGEAAQTNRCTAIWAERTRWWRAASRSGFPATAN